MKTVIVYYHPYNRSFCHALLEAAKEGAENAELEVDVIDLDAEKFDPVMSANDLRGFVNHEMVDVQAKELFGRIRNADHMIMIFPIWWELMPAMVKGFIDKVVFPGSFYEQIQGGFDMLTLLPNLKVTIITTMNTPALMYKFVYKNAIYRAMVSGTFKKIGIRKVKWVNFGMVKFTKEETRQKWLKKTAQIGAGK